MATITLEISDGLASELEALGEELPVLLAITHQLFRPVGSDLPLSSPVYLAYKQLLDFMASARSPEEIRDFRISPQAEQRVHTLLDAMGEDELSPEERAELRVYAQMNDLIGLKKAQAAVTLDART